MKHKPHVRLISSVRIKKKYTTFMIYCYDDGVYEFNLSEWWINRDDEWVELTKLDNTEMNSFAVQNIVRVRFTCVKAKSTNSNVGQGSPLKPVA